MSTGEQVSYAAAGTVETDLLGEPWLAETIGLPPDDEGPVVTTLVSRAAERDPETPRRAVLYLHGFTDYFFQTELADWWLERGYDFYAVDLRKYGRSLRPHQTPTYIADLSDYHAELDLAWQRITVRDGHTEVVLVAHSTGGLIAPLWVDARRPAGLIAMVLNSPWLDLQGAPWLRTRLAGAALDRIGRRSPLRVLGREVKGLYGRSIHRDYDGEWDFDLAWKPIQSFPVRFGWLRAVRLAHTRLQRGLSVPAPVLVLSSDASAWPTEMGEQVHDHDIVLDVAQIRRWSTAIGEHVTYAAVAGARHDVVLSRPGPRAAAYEELRRWVGAYLSRD